MSDKFLEAIESVRPVDRVLDAEAQERLDNLTKPKGSLGRLEEVARTMYMIQEQRPLNPDPARVYTVAGDHGVVEEGVSLFPQEVTRQMVANFLAQGAGVNALANQAGVEVKVVDAGCCGPEYDDHPDLIQGKVAQGTENFTKGPAMSMEQCVQALILGVNLADQAAKDGVRTLLTGDMGIGNTTPSTALYCAYLGLEPEEITGPGTGLDSDGVTRKAAVIRKAIEVNKTVVSEGDGVNILAALGGYEIACLAGLIIGAAANRQMVLVDGFISTAAYAAAWKICPNVADYCLLSHASAEPGHKLAVEKMGQKPLLHLDMRLGEGTGAVVALGILRGAAAMFNDMASFTDAGVTEANV